VKVFKTVGADAWLVYVQLAGAPGKERSCNACFVLWQDKGIIAMCVMRAVAVLAQHRHEAQGSAQA